MPSENYTQDLFFSVINLNYLLSSFFTAFSDGLFIGDTNMTAVPGEN
jgi:hypothetical protein